MKNALAVYTARAALKGRNLADIARDHGIQLRFLGLGGYLPGNPPEIQNKALTTVNGGGLLVVGGFDSDTETLVEFDKLVAAGDRAPIATMLNGAKLPWCELYTGRFNYEQQINRKPKDKSKIDGSVPRKQLPALKAAKTRYIIYNQSGKKNGERLMTQLAEALAAETGSVLANYQR